MVNIEIQRDGMVYRIGEAAAAAFQDAMKGVRPEARKDLLIGLLTAPFASTIRIENWYFAWRHGGLCFAPIGDTKDKNIPNDVRMECGYWEQLDNNGQTLRTANLKLAQEVAGDIKKGYDMGAPCSFDAGNFVDRRKDHARRIIVRNSVIVDQSPILVYAEALHWRSAHGDLIRNLGFGTAAYKIGEELAKKLDKVEFMKLVNEINDKKAAPTTPAATNSKEKAMDKNEGVDFLGEAQVAGVRIAANQLCTLVQAPLAKALAAKFAANPDEQGPMTANIVSFLQSDFGKALIANVLAVGLTQLSTSGFQIPGIPAGSIASVARELRIMAMEVAGNEVSEIFAGPLREALAGLVVPTPQVRVEGQEQAQLPQAHNALADALSGTVRRVNFAQG